ncbi:MAG TPA: TolC family protein [Luteimonas sp.]|nr:TolC family protein [Luteimonas sp.]
MQLRTAAIAALALASCLCAPASAQDPASPLTLDAAFARVAAHHPGLRLTGARGEVLRADRDAAVLPPPLRAGFELENVLGSGDTRLVRQAEATLTLAGVFERGGKLDARRTLAQGRIDALAVQREAQRLDLLAAVATRYLAVQAARADVEIAGRDVAQRSRTVAAARQRLRAGASPESVVLTAEAARARAGMTQARAAEQQQAARRHLAALWGEREPGFAVAEADPLRLPAIEGLDVLDAMLQASPELAEFADERRIREARLRLARSSATPDLDWSLGLRRLQAGDEFALVGSVSVPLGATRRADPEIRAAAAELAVLELEQQVRGVGLYADLAEAHGRYRVAQLEVEQTGRDILPRLVRAEQAAERAYRAGATSYLEWAQLQADTTAARRQQLLAAVDAQGALIELQRLTGAALLAADAPATTHTQDTSP